MNGIDKVCLDLPSIGSYNHPHSEETVMINKYYFSSINISTLAGENYLLLFYISGDKHTQSNFRCNYKKCEEKTISSYTSPENVSG